MAAQPSFLVPITDRETGAFGRRRVRHETYLPGRQRYRQTPIPEKSLSNIPSDLFPENLGESWPDSSTANLGAASAMPETIEADPLPRIRASIDKLLSPCADDGDPQASNHAYQSARAVIESAYGRLLVGNDPQAKKLPFPIVTTDERGGVRFSWQHNDRHVRTSFAASENLRSYLYFESPIEHDVETLQPDTLSARLDWMLKA